jgi:hypothetical protein
MHHHQQVKIHLMLVEKADAAQCWCRLFREHRFIIGLSLEGSEALQDQHRPDKRGRALAEQPAPGVVDQRAIGLQTVADGDAVGGITRLQA